MFRFLFRLAVGVVLTWVMMTWLANRADAHPPTYLPYSAGSAYTVIQGNGGSYSHYDQYNRYGWDFAMPTGTAVIAAAPGTVAAAGWDSTGWGNTVVVCYGDGTCSRYAHLSQIAVGRGQQVGQAQLIGQSGSTGRSSGPHLHYQLETTRGISSPSQFVEAGVPPQGSRPVSQNRGDPNPQFEDIRTYSSPVLDVTAGDTVRASVTARYLGPAPIPCGKLNLGVRNDSAARFADYSAGFWPNSVWRSPNRVAAAGCNGSLSPGQSATWHLDFQVPTDTLAGEYVTGVYSPVWDGVGWSGQQFPISLRVRSGYGAGFVNQSITPVVAPGGTGEIQVSLKNTGRQPWRKGEVSLATPADARFAFADSSWNPNGNRIPLQQDMVQPGETGTFRATFAAPSGSQPSRQRLDLVPIREGRERFSQELGLHLMVFIGDEQHPPFAADDYTATYLGQTYRQEPMATGETGEVTVTFRNDGWSTWYDSGPQAVHFRGINPTDRQSGFIDPDDPRAVGRSGAKVPRDVAPGETVTITLPLKVASGIRSGTYPEYFRLVAENSTWFGRSDIWWPFTVK